MANKNVVDELVVELTLDTSGYEAKQAEVGKQVDKTEAQFEKADKKDKTRKQQENKRWREATKNAKEFGNSLGKVALKVGALLGVSGGVGGLVGAVVALTGFETSLRRATVSTGLSNRELQAWGSAARRLGADADAGAQAIADLAKEQKQFHLTGNAPTLQAFNRLGINAGANTPIGDILGDAQKTYRAAAPAQRNQIEAGLSASGVSADLITIIKSEKDAREVFARSFAESATENRKALDSVTDALAAVKNSALNVANAIATTLQPQIQKFADWLSQNAQRLSDFNDQVSAAGGGVTGFTAVLEKESPNLASSLKVLVSGLTILGQMVEVVVFGFKQLGESTKVIYDWVDSKLSSLLGGENRLKTAVDLVGWGLKEGWKDVVGQARGNATPVSPGHVPAVLTPPRSVPSEVTRGGDRYTNAEAVMQGLIARGMTMPQAAAMAANIQGESSFKLNSHNTAGGGRGARGLVNWRGARIDAFEKMFGITPDKATLDQQLDFITRDPEEQRLLKRIFGQGGTAKELGERVSRVYEGHGNVAIDGKRALLAQQYANAQGAGGQSTTVNISGPVTVKADTPTDFVNGIARVSGVQNYNSAVR